MQGEPSLTVHGPGRQNEWTVREFAERERVTVVTVRRWIAKGAIETRRTPSGGVRVVERINRASN